jgi:hypothetical protein
MLHVHNYPSDYWRFTPQALELLLQNYPDKIIGWHGPERRPTNVWAVAFRDGRPALTQREIDHYRRLMTRYARQPLAWGRALRYRLGRWLCGARPFDYYLEQNNWKILCRTSTRRSRPGRNQPRAAPRTSRRARSGAVVPAHG